MLEIRNLHVSVEKKEVLQGVTLRIAQGETVALMGPNGSGKSSLAYAIMGHPKYSVDHGDILFEKKSILTLPPDERSKGGIFLSFQHPQEIPGVSVANFMRSALQAHGRQFSILEFREHLKNKMRLLNIHPAFADRYVNEGFSGGEKKQLEMLQLSLLEPKLAMLDEPDSGLDIDALKAVAEGINTLKSPGRSVLIITHYQRILNYVTPDRILIMIGGKIVQEGDASLIHALEQKGYAWLRESSGS